MISSGSITNIWHLFNWRGFTFNYLNKIYQFTEKLIIFFINLTHAKSRWTGKCSKSHSLCYGITCLVSRSTLLPLVVLIYPLVALVCSLVVLVCPPVVSVCPLVVLVCPLVVFVCPLVVSVCPLLVSVCPLVVLVCPLVVSVCPLVVFVCPLVVLACPLVVSVCPLVVLVCPLVVSVCPLVVLVNLSTINVPHHTEKSQLICIANVSIWIGTLVLNCLKLQLYILCGGLDMK